MGERMNENLTGRVRHRAGWGGALVLQVEVVVENIASPHDKTTIAVQSKSWRDARVTDLTKVNFTSAKA